MQTVLQSSIRAGEAVTRSAERLLHVDRPIAEVPEYVRQLKAAAKFPRCAGDANLYEDAVAKYEAQIRRLGQGGAKRTGDYTMRSASQQLVADLRRAKPAQVDRIVDRWILEKARYQARLVVRNESVEAFRAVQLQALEGAEWAPGVKLALSPAHPRPDVCDCLVAQNLYGLGRGCYPADKVPARHTSCLCLLTAIVDTEYFARKLAQLRGEPEPPKPWTQENRENGNVWLRRQPDALQNAIAGPTRTKLLARGRAVIRDGAGQFIPVHELLNEDKPERQILRVDATKLVAADRLRMVQQYPPLPAE